MPKCRLSYAKLVKKHKIHKVVLHKVVYFVNLRGCEGELVWVPEGVIVVADCC